MESYRLTLAEFTFKNLSLLDEDATLPQACSISVELHPLRRDCSIYTTGLRASIGSHCSLLSIVVEPWFSVPVRWYSASPPDQPLVFTSSLHGSLQRLHSPHHIRFCYKYMALSPDVALDIPCRFHSHEPDRIHSQLTKSKTAFTTHLLHHISSISNPIHHVQLLLYQLSRQHHSHSTHQSTHHDPIRPTLSHPILLEHRQHGRPRSISESPLHCLQISLRKQSAG
jgi:hypothetical protein